MISKLFFCGRLNCKHNCDGTCVLRGVALNEAGVCVGYKPDPEEVQPSYPNSVN